MIESALEAMYYITDNFNIPQDCIEIIYDSGDDDKNNNSSQYISGENSNGGCNGDKEGFAAEMIILIPPIVFTSQPRPLMPWLNYDLARRPFKETTGRGFTHHTPANP